MKKLLFFLAPALLLAGCAQNFELEKPPKTEEAPQGRTRSLAGALYNEVTDSWMIPQAKLNNLADVQSAAL